EARRNASAYLTERLQSSLGDLENQAGEGLGDEWRPASDELVQDGAESPDVRSPVHVSRGEHLLRGHVERGAHRHGRLRSHEIRAVPGFGELGDAEVENLDALGAVAAHDQHEVRRFEIPMYDSYRVCLGDRFAGLGDVIDGVLERQGAPLADDGAEVLAVE